MLKSIHFLTTLSCNLECDHCFLFCGPGRMGTFTLDRIRRLLDEIVKVGTIESVCFEGGEPLLYYPLVLAGIEEARSRGLGGSIVTNGYWATSPEDAELWLAPLAERGVTSIGLSDDPLHYGDAADSHAEHAAAAGEKLGMTVKKMVTDRPKVEDGPDGKSSLVGGVMFRGRAAEKLTEGLPTRPWEELTECPHEKLDNPQRMHADCFGNIHLCQGLSMGNCWERPLSELVSSYDPQAHPIVGPLLRGGPAQLVREYDLPHEDRYVDECHLCFEARKALIDRFGEYLGPPQVYGLE